MTSAQIEVAEALEDRFTAEEIILKADKLEKAHAAKRK